MTFTLILRLLKKILQNKFTADFAGLCNVKNDVMTNNPSNNKKVELKNVASALCPVRDEIVKNLKKYDYSEDDIFAVKLALEEAFVNAVDHGNSGDPKKKVILEYTIDDKMINIKITDQGKGFEPEKVPDPRLQENIYKTTGRGVLLIKEYMDKVSFNPRGNRIDLIKFKKTKK